MVPIIPDCLQPRMFCRDCVCMMEFVRVMHCLHSCSQFQCALAIFGVSTNAAALQLYLYPVPSSNTLISSHIPCIHTFICTRSYLFHFSPISLSLSPSSLFPQAVPTNTPATPPQLMETLQQFERMNTSSPSGGGEFFEPAIVKCRTKAGER